MKAELVTELLKHSSVLYQHVPRELSSCGSSWPSEFHMSLSAEVAEEESGLVLHA